MTTGRHILRDRQASPATAGPPVGRARDAVAVVPVALLAVATLWWPESGDQSLFVLGAQTLRDGGVYYRDVWDIKQPGLYWFYQLGDLLVPGGLGARLIEVLLAVVAAVLVLAVVRDRPVRRSVRLAAPTMVLGPYLAWSFLVGVGQIEGLMNVVLLGVLAATWPSRGRPRPVWGWFVAGLLVGVVVLFKSLYGPIPVVLLAFAAVASARIDRRTTLGRIAALVVGGALPVVIALAYLYGHGVLELALRTTFELPSQVAGGAEIRNPANRLQLTRSLKNMFPVVGPLAALGLVTTLTTSRRAGRRGMHVALAATAVTAFVLAVPQLWTTYRWLMLAAPVGLLAVDGLEAALAWLDARRTGGLALRVGAGLAAAALTVPVLQQPASLVLHPGPWGLDAASRIARGEEREPVTRPQKMAAMVAGRVSPGEEIFVLGDPRITVLLHAVPATQVAGWAMPALPEVVWTELDRELERRHPRLVFVDGRDWSVQRAGPGRAVFDLIDRDYRVVATAAEGTWYQTDLSPQPLPEPAGNRLYATG